MKGTPVTRNSARPSFRTSARRVLRIGVFVGAAAIALPFLLIPLYAIVQPPASTVMLAQRLSGTPISQHFVALDAISPHLPLAVMASEDAFFCQHRGVDFSALKDAIEEAEDGGRLRGASTITMQTVKNLFLWSARSFVRKAIEMPLALYADLIWSKRRTLELYLNIAEWGPGVFGAEAAARHHFGKSAAALTRREAALLAAALPNPIVRTAGRPGPLTRRTADRIQRRMPGTAPLAACLAIE